MARNAAKELTERELEVMHVYWQHNPLTAHEARDLLAKSGADRAYVTIANLVRTLVDKGFLQATNHERPFAYQPIRSFDDVSGSLLGELVDRVFRGSHEQVLVQLLGKRKKLSQSEKDFLNQILKEQDQ